MGLLLIDTCSSQLQAAMRRGKFRLGDIVAIVFCKGIYSMLINVRLWR